MSENSQKIVTDDILKLAIEKVLIALSDYIYDETDYTETEVDGFFDGTKEQIEYYSSLINDQSESSLRLWSSSKVKESIATAILESNEYSDNLISNLSSINLKYVESLPDTGDSSTIYILKSASEADPDTLNLFDGTQWVTIGKFEIDMVNYVTTDAMNTALTDKANDSEVVKVDDILTSTTGSSNSNVLSAGVTVSELAKKIDKTSIVNTVSTNSTNDEVPSAKAVYDKFKGTVYQNKDLNLITEPGLYICANRNYGSHHFPVSDDGYLFHACYPENGFNIQIFVPNGIWGGGLNQYLRRQTAGTWTDWWRMCSTTVADVGLTTKGVSLINNTTASGSVQYSIKNGYANVSINGVNFTTGTSCEISGLPKPAQYIYSSLGYAGKVVGEIYANAKDATIKVVMPTTGTTGYGFISYPVAES